MLRKERELEEARNKLAMIRKQQYKFLPSELREDGQDQWECGGEVPTNRKSATQVIVKCSGPNDSDQF